MKSIPFFKSNGFYVAASFSSANTFFFSKEKECEILLSNLRRYLRDMIVIVDLRCYPGGWLLVFKTHSTRQIRKSYFRINKEKLNPRHEDVEHILSEQFRIANSMTVRSCNRHCNRSGSRVHSTLVKMIFENKKEYDLFLDKISKIEVFSTQSLVEFYPEFGRVVRKCGMEVDEFEGREGERELGRRVRKLKKFYGRLSLRFSRYIEAIRKFETESVRKVSIEVTLILIHKTKLRHKNRFQPNFSIFGVP